MIVVSRQLHIVLAVVNQGELGHKTDSGYV